MSEAANLVSFALIQAEKRSRFDPLRDLTPERLVQYMDEFRAGHVQNLARVMEAVEERDDVLASVVPKAKASVARHGWEVLTVDTEDDSLAELAGRQQEALEYFYNNVRATSALDQDEVGGMSLLLRQMMDAKGKRYAIHNMVWLPKPDGNYTATFHFTPLWFFENTTGRMRFISQPFGFYGEDMEPGAWLVTKGQGIMIACCIAYMYKRLPLRDWLIYCGRHGMPGIEGVTDSAEGSEEWNKIVAAVAAAAKEFAWVRSRSSEIKTIDFSASGELPYPALVERMSRTLATIWRGGDLATMSKDGSAVGSNPQSTETTLMEEDDAAWLSETLQLKVDRLVLDYVFGPDSPTLAYVKVLTAQKQNTELDLKIDQAAVALGHPVSQKQFAERYNRPLPDEGDPLLGTATSADPAAAAVDPSNVMAVCPECSALVNLSKETELSPGVVACPKCGGPVSRENLSNPTARQSEAAANEAAQTQAQIDLTNAVATDLEPVRAELAAILNLTDDTMREVKLRAFLARIEQLKAELPVASATQRTLAQILGSTIAAAVTTKTKTP